MCVLRNPLCIRSYWVGLIFFAWTPWLFRSTILSPETDNRHSLTLKKKKRKKEKKRNRRKEEENRKLKKEKACLVKYFGFQGWCSETVSTGRSGVGNTDLDEFSGCRCGPCCLHQWLTWKNSLAAQCCCRDTVHRCLWRTSCTHSYHVECQSQSFCMFKHKRQVSLVSSIFLPRALDFFLFLSSFLPSFPFLSFLFWKHAFSIMPPASWL